MILASLPLCALLSSLPATHPGDDVPQFAPPVLLTGGGEPLGRGVLYPSPALFDVDGDGAAELVIGDLFGRVHVAERLPGEDPGAWSAAEPLRAADGELLKFSNW